VRRLGLRHASCAIRDPELNQPGDAGNRQQPRSGGQPAAHASAVQPGNDCADYRPSGSNRGDDVADPVDEVQEGIPPVRDWTPV